MSITITDPVLLAQLAQAGGVVELKDPTGRVIGTFTSEPFGKPPPEYVLKDPTGRVLGALTPEPFGKPPPGYVPPISDEEIERRRQLYRDGKSLSEILRRLQGGGSA